MTQLKCSVRSCMYNDNEGNLCSKGDIMIGGKVLPHQMKHGVKVLKSAEVQQLIQ